MGGTARSDATRRGVDRTGLQSRQHDTRQTLPTSLVVSREGERADSTVELAHTEEMMKDDMIHDAPENWTSYRAMLSSLTPVGLDPQRREAMREQIAGLGRGRHARPRWYMAGSILVAAFVVAIVVAFVVPTSPLGRARFDSAISSPIPNTNRQKATHRSNHRRLPAIPHSSLPTAVDTAIPGNPGGYPGHHPSVSPVPPAATGR